MADFEEQSYGNFKLIERIAVGGMAEIFRAKKIGAEGFEKELVIKRILPHFSEDEAFVTMFKDEARIAANLNHANIVQVYEFDERDNTFYIAMEYIEGKDLKRIIDTGAKREKPLLCSEAVYIIAMIADGLHYAHTRTYNGQPLNIVHRDVSPHNIMVSFDGDVKLMDFGIAKAAARSTKTQAGTVKGKCAYMSPEQARGKDLDGRSDMFSLGICLWEMVTHSRLFVGDTEFETLSKVLKAEIPSPRELNPECHPKLEKLILQSLARDRDMRLKDLGAFKQALMSFFYQHCDPDTLDLGGYMRWLYRKGPLPRSREAAAPPPTMSAPAYRPPAAGGNAPAALPEGVQTLPPASRSGGAAAAGAAARSTARKPEVGAADDDGDASAPSERTAVMPEMSDKPAHAAPASVPKQDPTIPMEPYRPQDHDPGRHAAPPRGSRRTGQTGQVPVAGGSSPGVKGRTESMPADEVASRLKARTGQSGKVGAMAAKGASSAGGGKKKLPLIPLVIGAMVLVLGLGSVGAWYALRDPESGEGSESGEASGSAAGSGVGSGEAGGSAQAGAGSGSAAGAAAGSGDSAGSAAASTGASKKQSVRITSEPPGADVTVNSDPLVLPTPTTFNGAKTGDVLTIRVRKTGFATAKQEVTVTEGMEPVKIVLEKKK